jgi:hypothetical protein
MSMDANMKLLYATDPNEHYSIDTIEPSTPFDVVADVEIGKRLFGVTDKHELFVSVLNVSRSETVLQRDFTEALTPEDRPHMAELRVSFPDTWTAKSGDVLEVVATYKVSAGINTDYSHAESRKFVVA